MPNYFLEGLGSTLVPNPTITYIGINDPVLGTTVSGQPDGPINGPLWKLLENIGALADTFQRYLTRTSDELAGDWPEDSTVAHFDSEPSELENGLYHSAYYDDLHVLYKYNTTGAVWEFIQSYPR